MSSVKLPTTMSFGGDYNPEQWSKEIWEKDAQLMEKSGVNLVSLGIFSWSKIEPSEGQYQFDWLDEIIEILYNKGVYIDLATATASPPAWMIRKYPDILPVDREGNQYSFGSRQHYCPNNRNLIERTEKLVEAIAERYQNHPAVKMWHINNEYACHISECYCQQCLNDFQNWVKDRYETIDSLNEAWGTNFWSQRYYNWDEISLPGKTPTFTNPGQRLDYYRFMNDSIFNLFMTEKKILRKYTPNVPITTNFMGPFKPLNYFEWAKEVDIVSWDSYPDPSEGMPVMQAMMNDLMRGLRKGQPFLLMEQVTSQVNWREINVPKSPGTMRRWSYSTVGRGGDGILFFQWRQSQAGAEKFHSAMVSHTGNESSRVYREVHQLGNELKGLKNMVGATTPVKVAMLFDWENWWAVELDSKPHNKLNYIERVYAFYKVLFEQNIAVDFVQPGESLSDYEIVLAPMLYMVSEKSSNEIKRFVENGGTFVTTYFSGIVDENDRIYLGGYPQPFSEMLGLYVEEFVPFKDKERKPLLFNHRTTESSLWSEHIITEGAEPIAYFGSDWLAGEPAVTRHDYGKGRAIYVGTELSFSDLSHLLLVEAGLSAHEEDLQVPANVECLRREKDGRIYYILINHNAFSLKINLKKKYENVLEGNAVGSGQLQLPKGEVLVLKELDSQM